MYGVICKKWFVDGYYMVLQMYEDDCWRDGAEIKSRLHRDVLSAAKQNKAESESRLG